MRPRSCSALRYGDDDEPETIKGGLVERWGDSPVDSIDGHDIWSVIDEARRIGVPGTPARSPAFRRHGHGHSMQL
jgi:hypothetical protein